MGRLVIDPPLLNSANPWCTSLEQLQQLYNSAYTGAVTTRTSLIEGFTHDETVHQFAFYNPNTLLATKPSRDQDGDETTTGSLNTLGYSPLPLVKYLEFIKTISDGLGNPLEGRHHKPFIVSVTGTVDEVVQCYKLITSHQKIVRMVLAMEVNLSCPNIPGKPPPAYNSSALSAYLEALKSEITRQLEGTETADLFGHHFHVPIGIKTPPYTYHDQFQALIDALLAGAKAEPSNLPCPVSFITATNTLGSSLLLSPRIEESHGHSQSVLHRTLDSASGTGIGGLAGAPLHPLALGNVHTIKGMLFQNQELNHIQIIGVGGVEDIDGYNRMRAVGASAVGVGTALGRKGSRAFEEIGQALGEHS